MPVWKHSAIFTVTLSVLTDPKPSHNGNNVQTCIDKVI